MKLQATRVAEAPTANRQSNTAAIQNASMIKSLVKKLRVSQPFNYIGTTLLRSVFTVTRDTPEFVVKHFHKVGNVRLKLPEGGALQLWSRADDWVSNQIFWRGWAGYEPETISLFYRLAKRASTTLDVGAYVGFYTLLAGHANTEGRVFAFEPMPEVFGRLQRNVALNKLMNVQCVQNAVGEADATADFFHDATDIPCSSSLSYDFMKAADGLQVTTVSVIKLDSFVRENEIRHVDLMKIDTESTEPEVLRGMYNTLMRDKPFIICEVLGRGSERHLEEILGPLGYRYYQLTPNGPIHREKIEGHPEWLNYMFTTLSRDEVVRL